MEDEELGDGKTCLIIGPIGSRHAPIGTPGRNIFEASDQLWEKVFEPATQVFKLDCVRADKISETGDITEQIFVLLRDADVVIADVTGGNSNVMYELGLRHTRSAITVQVGEYERLPFDINTIRTIQFTRTSAGLVDLRQELVVALRTALEGRGSLVTATRVWLEAQPNSAAAVLDAVERSQEADDRDEEVVDEPGFIDLLAQGEESLVQLVEVLSDITSTTATIGSLLGESTVAVKRSDANRGGFAGRLRVATELAENLSGSVATFESDVNLFVNHISQSDPAVNYILDRIESDAPEDAGGLLQALKSLGDSIRENAPATAEFMAQADGMRRIARALSEPSRTIKRSLSRFLESCNVVLAWSDRAVVILQQLGEPE